ncbi:AI-2E family transporter [Prauserella flavalba]|uniref:AI-2E family transporter n=1 Tax=Prauserella flavalba TaxID=1477506 RepID=UPI0036E55F2A
MKASGRELIARGVPRGLMLLIGGASVVVIIAGLKLGAWLLGPFFLAGVIVITLSPATRWLRAHRVPGWVSTALLVVLVYAVIAALVLVLVVSIAQLASLLPSYAGRAHDLVTGLASALERWGVSPQDLRPATDDLDFGRLVGYVRAVLGSVTSFGAGLLFLLALLLFLSIEAAMAGARKLAVTADRPGIGAAITEFVHGTRRYMLVTTVFGLIVAVLDAIALLIMGIPLPVLWGVLAFITNYIPNVGFLLGLAPPALLALLDGDWQLMLAVIVVYSALNFVVQSLIQPRFVGNAVGLSTIATFVSLVFWGWIIGPLGAILAVPLTLLVKALLVDVDPRARWVNALLASRAGVLDRQVPADAERDVTRDPE